MVIVSSLGDPIDDEIEATIMFSRVFPYFKKIPGSVVDQAWVNRLTRPG